MILIEVMGKLLDILNMENWKAIDNRNISSDVQRDNSHEAQIALELLKSLGIGGEISFETQQILNKCHTRQEVCREAIKRCMPPTTAKRLYITSHAYIALGAKYRKDAIEFLKKYIAIGACWEGTPRGILNIYGYPYNQLTANKSNEFYFLGKAYEGEYMLDNALVAYNEALKLHEDFQGYYVSIANVYRKKNELDNAIAILNEAEKTWYYKNVEDFKTVIMNYKNKYNDMKKRGYVYTPRKKLP